LLFVAFGASCAGEPAPSSSPKSSNGGAMLEDIPVKQAQPAPAGPLAQMPTDSPTDMSSMSRPFLPSSPREPRLVTDFELEAQQDTPRAADARGLGGACQSSADCKLGLGCADVIFSGVRETNIAGGYCSRWCEQDGDCALLGLGARCSVKYFGSDLNLCLTPCVTGDAGGLEKCRGRHDLSCGFASAPGVESSCLPHCTGDEDCSVGRCNSGHGLCDVNLSSLATPVGGLCQPNASACDGFCSPSAGDAARGVCSGYCRLGSTCGTGPGTVCAASEFGLREGDGGTCERSCNTSLDCRTGYTACAPTGLLLPSGDLQMGCSQSYDVPANLAPQRLSAEQLQLAHLPSGVINVSTSSIFEALSQRLDVENGAVCVTGDTVGNFGALVYLDFQLRPNNGPPFDASAFSAFTLDVEGAHVLELEADAHGRAFNYLTEDTQAAGNLGEGPQRVGFDELFDLYAAKARFTALDAAQLEAVRFSLIFDDGPGPFRVCIANFALQASAAPAADAGP
jgi:hypothetical protein